MLVLFLSVQTELCRKVIRLYQDIAVSWLLDKVSWEYLLSVLLHHTHTLLTHKDTALGIAMANSILKVCEHVCQCLRTPLSLLSPTDPPGVLLEGFHSNQCEPCPLGQAGGSIALPDTLERGHCPVEGQL